MNYFKAIFSAIFILSAITFTNAQTTSKGDLTANAGIGLLPTYFMDLNETVTPPIQLGLDYKLADALSIGAFAGYSDYKGQVIENSDGSIYTANTKSKMAGVRLAVNTINMDKWEVYGGFQLAYSLPDVEYITIEPGEQRFPRPKVREGFVYSGFVGVTGYVTERIGFFGELGYGVSLINAGVKTKLFSTKKK